MITDEYTALQKYISTYRDPRAAAAEDRDDGDKKDKKPWYQACGSWLHLAHLQ